MSWHVETELFERYAAGTIDQASSFSIEAHLLSCATCRAQTASLVGADRMERIWHEVGQRVDAPRRGPVEALLLRLGMPDHLARLLAATPSLSLSWFLAVAVSLSFTVTAAYHGQKGLLVFLVLAPLLPLAGIAAAYGPGIDPTYEIGLAAPIRSFRLLLIRASAVLASTTVLAGAAALALPGLDWTAAAWLLPSLALTVLSLGLATFASAPVAFGSVAVLWIAVVTLVELSATTRLAAFHAFGQVTFLIVAVVAALLVARRREAFDMRRQV